MSDEPAAWGHGVAVERHPWGGLVVHALVPALFTWYIFVAGSAPAEPDSFQVNDKLAHALVFFALSLSVVPLAAHWSFHFGSGAVWAASATCAGYAMIIGAALEFWQARIPHRTADFWDWVADAVGAVLAAALISKLLPVYVRWRSSTRV